MMCFGLGEAEAFIPSLLGGSISYPDSPRCCSLRFPYEPAPCDREANLYPCQVVAAVFLRVGFARRSCCAGRTVDRYQQRIYCCLPLHCWICRTTDQHCCFLPSSLFPKVVDWIANCYRRRSDSLVEATAAVSGHAEGTPTCAPFGDADWAASPPWPLVRDIRPGPRARTIRDHRSWAVPWDWRCICAGGGFVVGDAVVLRMLVSGKQNRESRRRLVGQ